MKDLIRKNVHNKKDIENKNIQINRLINEKKGTIRNFGKLLITNQILTSGFSPTFGSYIDLIPSQVLTTSILNPSKQSPVQFFKQESEELMRTNYFDDFAHDFVRTYGL